MAENKWICPTTIQSFSEKKTALFHFWIFVFRYGFSTETNDSSKESSDA